LSVPRGLFRTISLLATGADMHVEELAVGWQRVFASLMRLMGTALIATFTAIVTNYLLRARLGPALELRRIPDSGHIVVCGLGNIGYGIVEELRQRGEPVVVIERAADNRFIGPARQLGAAVIVGDATVLEVLRQAHAHSARALIAATDSELANMEIALLVRELNPKQRVVTGVADPHLAQVLREAANIRLAVSTSALAAPAFVATLFGDRVANVFLIAGRVLAAVELAVQADDSTLVGHEVGAFARAYGMVPVSLVTAAGAIQTPAADYRLSLGDSLTGILALPDLARLLRRERGKD
jgi:Trk K+ transport system NAD-binding subunit